MIYGNCSLSVAEIQALNQSLWFANGLSGRALFQLETFELKTFISHRKMLFQAHKQAS